MRSIPFWRNKEAAWRIVYSGEFPRVRMKARIECLYLRERAESASTCWEIRPGSGMARLRIRAWMNTAIFCCEILQLEGADMSAQDETASDGLVAEQGEKTTPAACCREEQKGRNAGWTAE